MTDSCSKFFENIAQPGRLAWLVFRSIARFWAAIFLPYFRVWGETEFKAGSIIVARNFGLQTWIYCLRFFRRPVRIVLVDDNDDLKWFKVAEDGGLEPVCIKGSVLRKIDAIQELSDKGEIVFLIIPNSYGGYNPTFVAELEKRMNDRIRLFAIQGAMEALPPDAMIPKFASICIFCGRPFYNRLPDEGLLDELSFLESTLYDLDIDEEPSFFRNNIRNQ